MEIRSAEVIGNNKLLMVTQAGGGWKRHHHLFGDEDGLRLVAAELNNRTPPSADALKDCAQRVGRLAAQNDTLKAEAQKENERLETLENIATDRLEIIKRREKELGEVYMQLQGVKAGAEELRALANQLRREVEDEKARADTWKSVAEAAKKTEDTEDPVEIVFRLGERVISDLPKQVRTALMQSIRNQRNHQ